MYDINSKDYWNTRFTGDWQAALGRQQTVFFAQVALASCPGWFIDDLRAQKLSICDWGCALGDAVPPLARTFPDNTVVGWDFSEVAIQEARKLAPHFTFYDGDIRDSEAKFDVVFSSNTFEHFHNPFAVMTEVSVSAKDYLWIVVPFLDDLGIDEHFFRFEHSNIKSWLIPNFSLVYFNDVDVSTWPHTRWPGRQATLIYTRAHVLPRIARHGYEVSPSTSCETFVSPSLEISVRRLAERDLQLRGITERMTAVSTAATELEQTLRGQLAAAQSDATNREQQLNLQISALEEDLNSTKAKAAEIEPLRVALDERDQQITAAAVREQQLSLTLKERDQQIAAAVERRKVLEGELSLVRGELDNVQSLRREVDNRYQEMTARLQAENADLQHHEASLSAELAVEQKTSSALRREVSFASRFLGVATGVNRRPGLAAHLRFVRLLKEARQAARKGDWVTAERTYVAILKGHSAPAELWVQYGHSVKEQGDASAAFCAYQRALQIDPELADAHLHVGHALKMLGLREDAKAAYGRAYRLQPALTPARLELLALGLTPAELTRMASSKENRSPARRYHDKQGLRVQFTLRSARRAARQKNWALAESRYRRVLQLRPFDPRFWVQLGHALKEQGNLTEAEGAYLQARTFDPDSPDVHLQLGHVLKLQGRLIEAIDSYKSAYRLQPAMTDAQQELLRLGLSEEIEAVVEDTDAAGGTETQTPPSHDVLVPPASPGTAAAITRIAMPSAPDTAAVPGTTIGVLMLVADFDKGGLEQVVFDLSRNLKARGLWVGILIFGRSGEMGSKTAEAGIPVFGAPEPLVALEQILDTFSSLVILAHHCYSGWNLAVQHGAKIVEIVHNTYHWQLGDHSIRAIRSLADQFVAVSRSARDYAVAYLGIDPNKTAVINNGLLADGFERPNITEMDRSRNGPEFRVLQVANIYGHKCHNTMLTAFRRFHRDHPEARLIFAGDVVEYEVYQQLVRRIAAYGLEDVVTFTGHLDRSALGRLYASVHVSVLPSIVEGFSIASLESAYFGVPLIATDTGAARDLIKDDDIGIVIRGPVDDLSQLSMPLVIDLGRREDAGHASRILDALERMIGDREAWEKKSRTALNKVKSFGVRFTTDRYEDLIRRLIAEKQQAPALVGASRGERGLVSIVMPVYNHASLLPQAIQAVIDQTYARWELIVVNDGSNDNFDTVVRPFLTDSRIRFLTQPNQKLPTALNNGFRCARGEYLTWTSADNIMLPKQLERLVQALEEDHGAGLAYSNYYAIDDRGTPLNDPTWRAKDRPDGGASVRLPRTVTIDNFHPVADDYGDNFIGASFLYRAEIASAVGTYDLLTFGGEDYDFWLRMHLITRFQHVDEYLYLYRVHDNTISARFHNLGLPDNVRYALASDIQRRDALLASPALARTPRHSPWRYLGQYDPAKCCYRSVRYSAAASLSAMDGISVCEIDVPLRSVEPERLHHFDIVVATSEATYFWLKQCPAIAHKRLFCGNVDRLSDVLGHAAAQCSFERSRRPDAAVVQSLPAQTLRAALPHHLLILLDEINDHGRFAVAGLAQNLRSRAIRVTIAFVGEFRELRGHATIGGSDAPSYGIGLNYDLEALDHYIRSERVEVVSRHDTLLGAGVVRATGVPQCFVIHDSAFWSSVDGLGQWRDVASKIETYVVPSREMAEVAEGVLGSRIGRLLVMPENCEWKPLEESNPARDRLVEACLHQYVLARMVSESRRTFGNDA